MSDPNKTGQAPNDEIDSLGDREDIIQLQNADHIVDSANQEIK